MTAPAADILIGRIAVGAALGAVIGYERDRHGRHVGLRTHTLVAMAAATFMVLSAWFASYQSYAPGDIVDGDASRIAASVVSGIGFLAGGAILRTGFNVQGLTTAAGLWLVTSIGMCAGAGMFAIAAAVTGMGFFALTALRRIEDKDSDTSHHRAQVVVDGDGHDLIARLAALGVVVRPLGYAHRREETRCELDLELSVPGKTPVAVVIALLERDPAVQSFRVESRT